MLGGSAEGGVRILVARLYRLVSPIRVGQRLAGVGIDRCARATRCARRAVRAVALSLSRQKLGVLGAGRGLFRLLGGDDAVLARQVLVPLVLEQGLAGLALHGLALEQHAGHEIHLIGVGGQNRVGPIVGLLHDLGHLFIDATGRLLGVILGVAVVAAQEHLVVGLAEHLGAQRAHAVLGDDGAGHLARALKVVGGAGGDVVAEDLLGHAAAHEHRQLVFHLGKRV